MKARLATLLIVLAIGCVLGGALIFYLVRPASPPGPPAVHSTQPTITEIKRLGELVSTQVNVSDVLVSDEKSSDLRGYWLIKGDGLLSVDMTKAEISGRDDEARTAVIRLPEPRAFHARVDHDKTRVWSIENKSWLPWRRGSEKEKQELYDWAMKQAQLLVNKTIQDPRAMVVARDQAEKVITEFCRMIGWTVKVEWVKAAAEAETTK